MPPGWDVVGSREQSETEVDNQDLDENDNDHTAT
jgi:hypothetical protein